MFFHAMTHKYDRVFVQQLSPVTMSSPGVMYKRIRKAPLYTWVLDLWPESLTAAGGVTNKYILGFFRHYVKQEYKHSDKILISSRSFEKSIAEYGDHKEKVIYYPQWSDGLDGGELSVESLEAVKQVESSGVLKDGFKLMFAGAVGEAHGFECTLQTALLSKEHKDIKWIIVGDGRRLDWAKSFVKEHGLEETVFTLGRYPAETMPWFFKQADVMLITLNDDPLFKLYAPAKISSYMAAAKPIVAVLNGEGAKVIKEAECGWSLPAGDAESFAKLAIDLSKKDKAVLEEKGQNAMKYYNEHFVKEKCLRKLDEMMGL
jgi:glycosyltransferase involved in cell wall biosynthesis